MAEKSGVNTLHKFDLIKFAKEIISEVDNVRSYNKTVDSNTKEAFSVPTESRLNAFFRLIGLPMFVSIKQKDKDKKDASSGKSKGARVLTPGYDKFERRDRASQRIENAEEAGDKKTLSKDLQTRENKLKEIETGIGTQEINARMTKSLYIAMPLQANIPDDDSMKEGTVGEKDGSRTVFKKLKPLVTSFPKDGSIFPRKNELAKPFLPEQLRGKIDRDTILSKPFIETVMRIRLLQSSGANKTSDNDKTNDFVNAIKNDLGDSLYTEIFGSSVPEIFTQPNVLERFIIDKLISSTSRLALKWVELERKQQVLMQKNVFTISVKSTSSKSSPFGKRSDVTTDLSLQKESEDGKKLERLKVAIAKDEALLSLMPADDTTNIAGATPRKTTEKNVSKTALANSFISLINQDLQKNKKQLTSLQNKIKQDTNGVEGLRLELEMMTGEFTGLSVPDIVAVIIGLFLISKKNLLSLVDEEVKKNMLKDKTLKSAIESAGASTSSSPSDALAALKDLEKRVDDIYSLIKSQIIAIRIRNKRTTKLNQAGKKSLRKVQSPPTVNGTVKGVTKEPTS
jgi:hypothetical protein